jgi:hypothetical protein
LREFATLCQKQSLWDVWWIQRISRGDEAK